MGRFKTILLLVVAILTLTIVADYELSDDFTSANFNSEFTHFTSRDPTLGFVQYVDYPTAVSEGLINESTNLPGPIHLGVDHSVAVTSLGRPSVRLTSKKSYNHGLFIADIAHMPENICGVWPAFWLLGPDWPNSGEIDIVEGVNRETRNSMTLHTSSGCSVSRSGFSGEVLTSICDDKAPGQADHLGCGTKHRGPDSYGKDFNDLGGGVYATEWTSTAIKVWFFPRSEIPSDITHGTPDPSHWGTPSAQFAGECDIDAHFQNMQIVINTTFCGVWAGAIWQSGSCGTHAKTCEEWVANNPEEFKNVFWSINSIKVYQTTVEVRRHYGVRNEQRG